MVLAVLVAARVDRVPAVLVLVGLVPAARDLARAVAAPVVLVVVPVALVPVAAVREARGAALVPVVRDPVGVVPVGAVAGLAVQAPAVVGPVEVVPAVAAHLDLVALALGLGLDPAEVVLGLLRDLGAARHRVAVRARLQALGLALPAGLGLVLPQVLEVDRVLDRGAVAVAVQGVALAAGLGVGADRVAVAGQAAVAPVPSPGTARAGRLSVPQIGVPHHLEALSSSADASFL